MAIRPVPVRRHTARRHTQDFMSLDRIGVQSIPNAAATLISWNTETFDTEDWFNPGTPDRFLLPAGVFVIQAWVQWATNATGLRAVAVRRTASGTLGRQRVTANAGDLTEMVLDVIAQQAAPTEHSIEVTQTSTIALDLAFAKVRVYQVQGGD